MLGFSALKGVFPGRITLSRREPDATDSPSLRTDTSYVREASMSQSPEDAGGEEAPGSDAAPEAEPSSSGAPQTFDDSRVRKFDKLLAPNMVDLSALQAAAWTGIPHHFRPRCWRLLLRYEPPSRARAAAALQRRRREYADMAPVYYDIDARSRSDDDLADLKQVSVDVPRTAPEVPLFQHDVLQAALRRLLYIWGVRHPASGYVQGVNDLVTPFLAVFLSEYLDGPLAEWRPETLSGAQLLAAEADAYWCLSKLVERVQDVYTAGQPGIQRCLQQLDELLGRVDAGLARHFAEEGLSLLQFAFRWVNCMLLREVPFAVSTRLWDTYLAEGMQFGEFLPYVCAAFLLFWQERLRGMDFQEMILFLQKTPTDAWTHKELEMVLSHAHMLRAAFGDAQNHLT